MKDYDVIIIGGGPAGAAACLTLSKYTNLRCALLEAGDPGADFRIGETTSPALKPTLQYLGALEAFEKEAHPSCQSFKAAWGSTQLLERHSLFSGRGTGWHLDRHKFDGMLLRLSEENGAEVYCQTKVVAFLQTDFGWEITTQHNGEVKTYKCKFLIDASGRKSLVSRYLNIPQVVTDRLAAYMVVFREAQPVQGEVLMESTPDGWWYTSLLPGNKRLVAFMTDVDIAKSHGYNDLAAWGDHLCYTRHIYPALGEISLEEGLIIRPAHTKYLQQAGGKNWITAGEANLSFDPISSMGIGFALTSGIQAARICEGQLKGNAATGNNYHTDSMTQFGEYLQWYQQYYSLEKRWASMPFWKRRMNVSADFYKEKKAHQIGLPAYLCKKEKQSW